MRNGTVGRGSAARFGQVFLIDDSIAKREAEFAIGKRVVELGTGRGILTRELAMVAREVVSFEIDKRLFDDASASMNYENLRLINMDFFKANIDDYGRFDILVSNAPYYLSSRIIEWIAFRRIDSLLCLQKEFVERITAKEGDRDYNYMSVLSSIALKIDRVINVPRMMFEPIPRVDSLVIATHPTDFIPDRSPLSIISLLMEHKRKSVRNALIDSSKSLDIDRDLARDISESLPHSREKVFKISPHILYNISSIISERCNVNGNSENWKNNKYIFGVYNY